MNKTFPTLYGTTSTGKTKVWNCDVQQKLGGAIITVVHGALGGKQQETTRFIGEGKNIGKANETSAYEQAEAEARSDWRKKQDKGYTPAIPVASTMVESRLPMLAHKYTERSHDLVWPVFVQRKLNGVRCLVERTGDAIRFMSRGGKDFKSLGFLVPDFLAVMQDGDVLDGELYSHGAVSFQVLVGLIKDETPTPETQALKERVVKFYNYDRVEDAPFRERMTRLATHGRIVAVETFEAKTEAEAMTYHQQFTMEGYEGTMFRSGGDEPYRYQYRSTSLLKYKDFIDEEFPIVGVEQCDGKSIGQAKFVCQVPNGGTFSVRCKGTDESRLEQWTNRQSYIGQQLTVQYQQLSDIGIPIFPVGIALRDPNL